VFIKERSMSGIQHKVIAIAGASSGIGEAAARLLAAQGAKVMLGARRIGRLYALAHEIAQAGGSVHYQVPDVARRASMRCFIDEATRVFGRVDVIINNVGVMPLSMLDELSAGAAVITPDAIGSDAGSAPEAVARAIALAIERPADFHHLGEIVVRSAGCPHPGSRTRAMRPFPSRSASGLRLV
jgi:NAD(P)-dependent dehydrogenase (short-subunit alcohol dehydrogenase family)